jgi:GNAT superfamily N-acetyltransferase
MLAGQETLVGSWQALAQLSPGARVIQSQSAVYAVFPSWAALNNAILGQPPTAEAAAATTADLRPTYHEEAVDSWALWIPNPATDLDAPDEITSVVGMTRDTTTLVMRRALPENLAFHPGVVRTSIDAAGRAGDDPVPATELADPDDVPGLDGWVLVHRQFAVAGAWSYLHGTDCGIYAVGTVQRWRRRGFASALTRHILADARRRGARTATLQSTRMGQPLYASLEFTPVGRYDEWVPALVAARVEAPQRRTFRRIQLPDQGDDR